MKSGVGMVRTGGVGWWRIRIYTPWLMDMVFMVGFTLYFSWALILNSVI